MPTAVICCAARRWAATIPSTSGRSSMPPSANTACRWPCAPTTARPLPQPRPRTPASPPARSLRQQLDRFRVFQEVYNEERPHEALDNTPLADHYSPSPRSWDGVLRAPDYPDDHELRRVRHSGAIKWRGNSIYISQARAGEPVGLQDTDDDGWTVRYGPIGLRAIGHPA